ncbi:MAG TPA: hypothetical protein VIE86_05595 [Nitrososphaera sp.]|jgi:hypothetical protein
MEQRVFENKVEAYRDVRRRFYDAGDAVFGPGVLSMMEYYFMKKRGCNPFAMLLSEPRMVYDEWVNMFKGEDIVEKLIEKAAGQCYITLLEHIKKNDGLRVRNMLLGLSRATVA